MELKEIRHGYRQLDWLWLSVFCSVHGESVLAWDITLQMWQPIRGDSTTDGWLKLDLSKRVRTDQWAAAPLKQVANQQSWASASRLMPPASAFWRPVSQYGTGAFRYPMYPRIPMQCMPNDSLWKVQKWYTFHVWLMLMVLILLNDIEKSYVNAGMSECRRKVSPASSAFLPLVICLSPASVFQHQGSVRYRWSRISPALPSSAYQWVGWGGRVHSNQ
jgi:hypothetical protein